MRTDAALWVCTVIDTGPAALTSAGSSIATTSGRMASPLPVSLAVPVSPVLDEAYHEYVDKLDYASGLTILEKFPNLIVSRTFSKAYGLAGLRVGYCISNHEIADLLNRLREPFNVNSLALAAAEAVLDDADYLAKGLAVNREGMKQLEMGLRDLGLPFVESAGNFILHRPALPPSQRGRMGIRASRWRSRRLSLGQRKARPPRGQPGG